MNPIFAIIEENTSHIYLYCEKGERINFSIFNLFYIDYYRRIEFINKNTYTLRTLNKMIIKFKITKIKKITYSKQNY